MGACLFVCVSRFMFSCVVNPKARQKHIEKTAVFVFNICCATMSGAASSIGYSGNLVVVILVYCCNYGNIYLL